MRRTRSFVVVLALWCLVSGIETVSAGSNSSFCAATLGPDGILGVEGKAVDPDLPGAAPDIRNIPTGSLVIGMDAAYQSRGNPWGSWFNEKAYGLAWYLLNNKVRLEWVIRSDKTALTDVDLSVACKRVEPDVAAMGSCNFTAGPMIVRPSYYDRAIQVIQGYNTLYSGAKVDVYETLEDSTGDVRYDLIFTPKIGVVNNGGNAHLHYSMLEYAGIPESLAWNVTTYDEVKGSSCWTMATEAHYSSPSAQVLADVEEFLTSGGNVFTQCAGVESYEGGALLHTTAGISISGDGGTPTLPNYAVGVSQMDAWPTTAEGGTVAQYEPDTGSEWRNTTFTIIGVDARTSVISTGSKLARGVDGGFSVYIGGHSYMKRKKGVVVEGFTETTTEEKTASRRVFLNTVFLPITRPAACNLFFEADMEVQAIDPPSVVFINTPVTETFTILNNGPGNSPAVINFTVPQGFQFINISSTTGDCTYDEVARAGSCDFGSVLGCQNATFSLTTMPIVLNITEGVTITVSSDLPDPEIDNNQFVGFAVTEPAIRPLPGSGCVSPNETQTLTARMSFGDPLTHLVVNGPCTINGYDVSDTFTHHPTNSSQWTYTVAYTPSLFDGDWLAGTLTINCELYSTTEKISYNVTRFNIDNNVAGDTTPDQFGNMNCSELIICGDALINGTETCDDGNLYGRDGCTRRCDVLSGWNCTNTTVMPSQCWNIPICGDAEFPEVNEECDDGNLIDGDGCSASCGIDEGYSCLPVGDPDPLFIWSRTYCSPTNTSVSFVRYTPQVQNRYRLSAEDITVGERMTVVMNATLWEGPGNYSAVFDFTSGRFDILGAQVTSIGSNLGQTGSFFLGQTGVVSGSSVTFAFGTVSNVFDQVVTADDQFGVEVLLTPRDLPTNTNGDQLAVTSTLNYQNPANIVNKSGSKVVSRDFDLVMANVIGWLNVTAPPQPADAGDEIVYTLTLRHLPDSAAAVYDIVVNAIADQVVTVPGSVSANLGVVASASNSSSGVLAISAPYFLSDVGDMVITWRAKVNDTAGYLTPTAGDAVMAMWDLVGGPGGRSRNTTSATSLTITNTPTFTTVVNATSVFPPNSAFFHPAVPDATLLEPINVVATTVLKEGTSRLVVTGSVLTADPRLEVVEARVTKVGASITSPSLAVGATVTPSDNGGSDGVLDTAVFDFGEVVNAGDNTVDGGDEIEVTLVARFREIAANVAGSSSNVSLSLDYTNGTIVGTSQMVEVVSPVLTSYMNVTGATSGDAGDELLVTVTITHVAGQSSAPAYDIGVFVDSVGGHLAAVLGSFTSSVAGATAYGNVSGETAGRPWLRVPSFPVSPTPLVLTLRQRLNESVGYLVPIAQMTATAEYDTILGSGGLVTNMTDAANVTVLYAASTEFVINRTSVSPPPRNLFGPTAVDVVVGESVFYQARVTLREGTSYVNVSMTTAAALPRMEVLSARYYIGGVLSAIAGTLVDSNGDGIMDGAIVTPGTIVNPGDNVVDTRDVVVVEVEARPRAIPINVPGTNMNTTIVVSTGGSAPVVSAPLSIDIVGPVLVANVTWTGVTVDADAGDELSFEVIVTHASNSTGNAYNVSVLAFEGAQFSFVPGSLTVTHATSYVQGNATGAVYAGIGLLPLGETAVFRFRGRLADTVGYLTPSVSTSVGWSYQTTGSISTGQRHSGVLGAPVITVGNAPTLTSFTISQTSDPGTGQAFYRPAVEDLRAGEVATARASLRLREGTSQILFALQAHLSPLLLQVTSARLVSLGTSITGSAVSAPSTIAGVDSASYGYPDRVEVDLGQSIVNAADNTADAGDDIVIDFEFRVLEISLDQVYTASNVSLSVHHNSSTLVQALPVDLVEPAVEAWFNSTSIVDGDAGDLVTFTLTMRHIPGLSRSDAFNITLTNLVNPHLIPIPGSFASNYAAAYVRGNSSGETSVALKIDRLPMVGAPLTVSYEARLNESVGFEIANVITHPLVEWRNSPGVGSRVYNHTDTNTFTVANRPVSFEVAVAGTSNSATNMSYFNQDITDLSPGEHVRYRGVVYLREGTSQPSFVFSLDLVPAALEVVSSYIAFVGTGIGSGALLGMNGTATDSNADSVTDRVVFELGRVVNYGDNMVTNADAIVAEVIARVRPSALDPAGTMVNSTAVLNYTLGVMGPSTQSAEIVRADLVLVLSQNATSGDAGDPILFSGSFEHSLMSTSTAHNVTITTDAPPAWFTGATILSSTGGVSGSVDGHRLLFSIDTFPVDSSRVDFQFLVRLGANVGYATPTMTTTTEATWNLSPGGAMVSKSQSSSNITFTGQISMASTVKWSTFDWTTTDRYNPAYTDLVVGESITWEISVTLPEGVSKPTIEVQLPTSGSASLLITDSRVVSIGGNTGTGLAVGPAGVRSDTDSSTFDDRVVFTSNDITNPFDNIVTGNDQLVLSVTAQVRSTTANVAGFVGNVTISQSSTAPGPVAILSHPYEILEPKATLSLSVNTTVVDAELTRSGLVENPTHGSVVQFNMTIIPDPNSTPLFRVNMTSLLAQTDIVLLSGSVVSSAGTVVTGNSGGDTVVELRSSSPLQSSVSVTFNGYLNLAIAVGTTVSVIANGTFASAPDFAADLFSEGDGASLYLNIPGPKVSNFSVSDPDDQDRVYSNGDVFVVDFAEATNQPPVASHANVTSLLSFTEPLGAEVTGSWTTASSLRLVVVDTTGGSPAIGTTKVTVIGNLKNQAGTSVNSIFSSPLGVQGNFGRLGPQISAFVADDPDDMDAFYSVGDTYTVVFDIPTNQPPVSNNQDIRNLLSFNLTHHHPGSNLTGVWISPSQLRFTVVNITGASPPEIGAAEVSVRSDVLHLRDAGYTLLPSTSQSPPISGDWGTLQAPVILAAYGNDPDDGDVILSDGDTFRIEFDIPTNSPNITTKADLDHVFMFTHGGLQVSIGSNYTAAWDNAVQSQRLTLTILNATLGNATFIAGLQVHVLERASVQNKLETSLVSKQVFSGVTGDWGLPPGPSIIRFDGYDPDNLDIIYGDDDGIIIEFDKPTNQPFISGRSAFNGIFTITQGGVPVNFGDSWNAKWVSPTRIEIAIPSIKNHNPLPKIGEMQIFTTGARVKLNGTATSELSTTTRVSGGNWGTPPGPAFERLYFNDPDDRDNVFSDGDVLLMYFNMKTNRPSVSTKKEVDAMFTFNVNMGVHYYGTWLSDNRTMYITFTNTSGADFDRIKVGAVSVRVNPSVNLNNPAEDLLPSVAFGYPSGDFGLPYGPLIKALVCNDPDDADAVFSDGDTLTLVFDRPTNTPNATLQRELDTWLTFNPSLGSEYTGRWIGTNNDTLEVTVLNATAPPGRAVPAPFWAVESRDHIQVRIRYSYIPEFQLRDYALITRASDAVSPKASGDWGLLQGPKLKQALFLDRNNDQVFNDGDGIGFFFTEATNQPDVSTKELIDENFFWVRPKLDIDTSLAEKFGLLGIYKGVPTIKPDGDANTTQVMGLNYTGRWTHPEIMVMDFHTIGFTNRAPMPGNLLVEILAYIQNPEETSLPVGKIHPVEKDGPKIVTAIASDPDGGDDVYGIGDIITVTFDIPTSQVSLANKTMVDRLFKFSQSLGNDYSGVWSDPKSCELSVLDPAPVAPDLATLTVAVQPSGHLQDIYFLSLDADDDKQVIGDWGNGGNNIGDGASVAQGFGECRTFWCMWWWLLLLAGSSSTVGCLALVIFFGKRKQIAELQAIDQEDLKLHLRPAGPVPSTPTPNYKDRTVMLMPKPNTKKVLPVPMHSPLPRASPRQGLPAPPKSLSQSANARATVSIPDKNKKRALPTRPASLKQKPMSGVKAPPVPETVGSTHSGRTKVVIPALAMKKSLAALKRPPPKARATGTAPPKAPSMAQPSFALSALKNLSRNTVQTPKLRTKKPPPTVSTKANGRANPRPLAGPTADSVPSPAIPHPNDSQARVIKAPPAFHVKKSLASAKGKVPPPLRARPVLKDEKPSPEKPDTDLVSTPRAKLAMPTTNTKSSLPTRVLDKNPQPSKPMPKPPALSHQPVANRHPLPSLPAQAKTGGPGLKSIEGDGPRGQAVPQLPAAYKKALPKPTRTAAVPSDPSENNVSATSTGTSIPQPTPSPGKAPPLPVSKPWTSGAKAPPLPKGPPTVPKSSAPSTPAKSLGQAPALPKTAPTLPGARAPTKGSPSPVKAKALPKGPPSIPTTTPRGSPTASPAIPKSSTRRSAKLAPAPKKPVMLPTSVRPPSKPE